jgi:hypothetical protein
LLLLCAPVLAVCSKQVTGAKCRHFPFLALTIMHECKLLAMKTSLQCSTALTGTCCSFWRIPLRAALLLLCPCPQTLCLSQSAPTQ